MLYFGVFLFLRLYLKNVSKIIHSEEGKLILTYKCEKNQQKWYLNWKETN